MANYENTTVGDLLGMDTEELLEAIEYIYNNSKAIEEVYNSTMDYINNLESTEIYDNNTASEIDAYDKYFTCSNSIDSENGRVPGYSYAVFLKWMMIPCAFIYLFFLFNTVRVRLWPKVLYGRPGMPETLDTLHSENTRIHRIIKIAIFMVMADTTCRMSVDPRTIFVPSFPGLPDPQDMNYTLLRLYIMAFYSFLYAPLVMSVPRFDFIGFSFGSAYTYTFLANMIVRDIDCFSSTVVLEYIVLQYIGWLILCLTQTYANLVFWFNCFERRVERRLSWLSISSVHSEVRKNHGIFTWFKGKAENWTMKAKATFVGRFQDSYDYKYVQSLFKKPSDDEYSPSSCCCKYWCCCCADWWRRKVYDGQSFFRFHNRVISSIICGYFGLIIMFFAINQTVIPVLNEISQSSENMYAIAVTLASFIEPQSIFNETAMRMYVDCADQYIKAFNYSFTASSALATAFTWWSTWSFLNNHKRQFLALRQGKLKIPEDCTPQLQLTGSLKFQAYQAAYITWGYAVQLFAFWLIMILVAWIVWIPITFPIPPIRDFWTYILFEYIPSFFWIFVVLILQWILARYIVLQNPEVDSSIDNRRVYNISSYLFYFNNMFIGWSSLLLRLGYGILFGLLAIQRMDVPSLPSHTEAWDAAYRAYLGYLAMDMLHTNAVLKCFLVIIQSESKKTKNPASRAARIRWHLAYSLICNEELRLTRAHAKRLLLKRLFLDQKILEEEMKAENSRINKLVRKVRGDSKVIPISKNIEDGIMDEISSVVSRKSSKYTPRDSLSPNVQSTSSLALPNDFTNLRMRTSQSESIQSMEESYL